MRTFISYIKAFPRLRRLIEIIGIKIERLGRDIQRTLRQKQYDLVVKFSDYSGSKLGKFELSKQVTDDPSSTFRLPGDSRAVVPDFVEKLFDIDGVTYVCVEQYTVSIVKAEYADWEEIKWEVRSILHEEFLF